MRQALIIGLLTLLGAFGTFATANAMATEYFPEPPRQVHVIIDYRPERQIHWPSEFRRRSR